jgi:hypothetical protein
MDNTLGRYAYYRYATLRAQKLNEFGNCVLRGSMLHHVNDVCVISYDGHRIVEIYPDDTCYLIIPPTGANSGLMYRWNDLAPNVVFDQRRMTRATGITDYSIRRQSLTHTRTGYKRDETGAVITNTRLRYDLNGDISIDGIAQRVAIQDRVKYRAFNKQLKNLKSVLFAQIKMHTHVNDTRDWKKRSLLQQHLDTMLEGFGLTNRYNDGNAYFMVQHWIDTQDPMFARNIALLGYARCNTVYTGEDGMLRQVMNILGRAQRHFLQEHCVTIRELVPGSTNDQQSELQPSDGLREMQVSGEAEIRRQDPGTPASAAPGQN